MVMHMNDNLLTKLRANRAAVEKMYNSDEGYTNPQYLRGVLDTYGMIIRDLETETEGDDTLWLISDKNIKELKVISQRALDRDLSCVKNDGRDGFDRLKGLLAEYSDDDVDSVKLVRDVRQHTEE